VLFNHGRSTDPQTHYRQVTITEAASILDPVFVKHGYAFLYLFRRGEGLSADQGPFIGDLLEQEEAANGEVARRHLQYLLMTSDHLNDALAGLGFLKTLPQVDAHRIAVVGHSFGGQVTLLAAERDSTVRAAVAFAAAVNSWDGSAELRVALLDTARKITVPNNASPDFQRFSDAWPGFGGGNGAAFQTACVEDLPFIRTHRGRRAQSGVLRHRSMGERCLSLS